MKPLEDFHFSQERRSPYEVGAEGILDPQSPQSSGTMMREMAQDEKPREKALNYGVEALNNAELLALILGSGPVGKSVLDLAREMLNTNRQSLSLVSRMTVAELQKRYRGIGRAKALLIRAAIVFGQRAAREDARTMFQANSAESVFRYMKTHLDYCSHEEFWVLHLNQANRLIYEDRLSQGGLTFTAVDVKLLVKNALDHLAQGIILVHNHPSGTLQPSAQDDNLTHRIVEVAKICDIAVLDHVIVTTGGYYSYADQGRL